MEDSPEGEELRAEEIGASAIVVSVKSREVRLRGWLGSSKRRCEEV